MDGRLVAAFIFLAVPAALIGVTVWQFSSNPLSILGLLTVMIGGMLYLLTYTDSFKQDPTTVDGADAAVERNP